MRVRNKVTGTLGDSSRFNVHSLNEIIVQFDEGDCSSEFIRDYDVQLTETGEWKCLRTAFKERLVIPNEMNTSFGEPKNESERKQGFY
jgi:hypothetical protein